MKVLFLDIDGVCNDSNSSKLPINHILAERIKRIVRETKCNVVLSSTWKNNEASRSFVRTAVTDFIDCTPSFIIEGFDGTQLRGLEISAYLKEHPEVTRYAILDDSGWMFENQLIDYFKTRGDIGITEEIADEVIKHLK